MATSTNTPDMPTLENVRQLSNQRQDLEDTLPVSDDICNNFISFSPGRYRFADLLLDSPTESNNVNSLHQLSAAKTDIYHLEITDVGLTSPKCVLIETDEMNLLLLVRAACYAFNDVSQICEQASQLGRLVLCDLPTDRSALEFDSSTNPSGFLNRLMVRHICAVFRYSIVDGIPFVPLGPGEITRRSETEYKSLNRWLEGCAQKSVAQMWQEFVRLLRIGFKINSSPVVVFAFSDGTQSLSEVDNVLKLLLHQLIEVTDGGAMVLVGGKDAHLISSHMSETYETICTHVSLSRTLSKPPHA
jgi:hypothetical protein